MSILTGGEILAKALETQGVEALFEVTGDPMAPIYAAANREGIDLYTFRHEAAAALAAQAYAFAGRRIGVSVVASGPAMVNALNGIYTAWANGWPMLCIGGNGQINRRGLGDFQEAPQVEAAAPFTKWSVAVESPERIPYYVATVVRKALSGRPGPVYLDLPADVISAETDADAVDWLPAVGSPPRPIGDPALVQRALDEIRSAKRPLLILGNGAAWSGCADEARRLVDALGLPFLPSPRGKGIVPDDHPLNAAAARSFALRNADLVAVVGARLNWTFHFGKPPRFAEDVKVIQIDIEADEIGNNVPCTVGIVGDATMVLRQMLDEVGENAAALDLAEWRQALEAERVKNAEAVAPMIASDAAPMDFYRMFHEIARAVSPDATIVIDGEGTAAVSRQMLPNFSPCHRLDPGTSGGMGVGIPYALGAQVARPEGQVVCVSGDFAVGWNGFELETAVRYNLPIVFVVANNFSIAKGGGLRYPRYMLVRESDPALRSQPMNAEDVDYIEYEKVMQAFGGNGHVVASPADLGPALERALASRRPTLLNVLVSPTSNRKEQPFSWLPRRGRMAY